MLMHTVIVDNAETNRWPKQNGGGCRCCSMQMRRGCWARPEGPVSAQLSLRIHHVRKRMYSRKAGVVISREAALWGNKVAHTGTNKTQRQWAPCASM
eukprot:365965-Chlamydomonas_euryale.AAC.5